MAGEGGFAFEPGHAGGFTDEFGRGQFCAAGQGQQRRSDLADAFADADRDSVDGLAEPGDVGQFVAGQLGEQP